MNIFCNKNCKHHQPPESLKGKAAKRDARQDLISLDDAERHRGALRQRAEVKPPPCLHR